MAEIHPLLFQGTLLNRNGDAIKDAKIQLWQTDLDGNYLHPNPGAAGSPKSPDHASIVSDFQYFGTDSTDANGNFDFLTYRPGVYPNRPYSHFHFDVWLEVPVLGDDGEYTTRPDLVTQFYFKGYSHASFPEVLQLDVTEVDASAYGFGGYVNGTIVVDDGTWGASHLQVSPTQPEGPFYPIPDFFSMDNDLTTSFATDDATTEASVDPSIGAGDASTETPFAATETPPETNTNHDAAAIASTPTRAPAIPASKSPSPDPATTLSFDVGKNLSASTMAPTSAAAALGGNLLGLAGAWMLASAFLRK